MDSWTFYALWFVIVYLIYVTAVLAFLYGAYRGINKGERNALD